MLTPVDVSFASPCSTVASGYFSFSSAQAPVTCAAAIDVPEPPPVLPPGIAEVINAPGASRLRNVALLENGITPLTGALKLLPSPTAPTLTAEEMHAG